MYCKKNGMFFFNLIKRTLLSFTFFFCEIYNFCITYETKKNVPFFFKNGKERKDRFVLL